MVLTDTTAVEHAVGHNMQDDSLRMDGKRVCYY